MKEVERHLNVSYPTARARFDQILVKLGLEESDPAPGLSSIDVLESLAEGAIDVDEALRRLG